MLIAKFVAQELERHGYCPMYVADNKPLEEYTWDEIVKMHEKALFFVAQFLQQDYVPNYDEFEQFYTPVLSPLPEEDDRMYDERINGYIENRYFPARSNSTMGGVAATRMVWVCSNPFLPEFDHTDRPLVIVPDRIIDRVLAGSKEHFSLISPWHEQTSMQEWIIRLLATAYARGANDVEVSSHVSEMRVRFHEMGEWSPWLGSLPLMQRTSFLRTLCAMAYPPIDYESGMVHDFKIEVRVRGVDTSWRVSIAPAILGDSVTLRILPQPGRVPTLEELGFCDKAIMLLNRVSEYKDGLVLVTGATGMGKSTTLYAIITALRNASKKIFTVEDPVELTIPGTTQLQIKEGEIMDERFCVSFASGIRTSLRHKPDILVVGEIRDTETAQSALTASRTGHLTWATLHTNNVRTSVKRMMDLGVDATNLADTLRLVLSQRLTRRLCHKCKIPHSDGTAQHNPNGCPACYRTGYSGKIVVYELAFFDDEAREAIIDGVLKQHFPVMQEKEHYISRAESLQRLIRLGIVDRNLKEVHV